MTKEEAEQLRAAANRLKHHPDWILIRTKMIDRTMAAHDVQLRRLDSPLDKLRFAQGSREGLQELVDFVDNAGKADPPKERRPFV